MGQVELPRVDALSADDRDEFAAFRCDRGNPWSEAVEHMVRTDLADVLASGARQAAGIWDGEQLAAVAVFHKVDIGTVNVRLLVLATQPAYARRGYAMALLEDVSARARAEGASRVSGIVHVDNVEMLRLLESLDAVVFARDTDDDHLGFVLAV